MAHIIMRVSLWLTIAVLAGCSHAPLQDGFGEADANNAKVQLANPNAGKDVPLATLDGEKAERLLKSYRTDSGKTATGSIINVGQ